MPIIGNGFSNLPGSCAGISIAQNMIISGKLDYSDILPEGYSCFMDLPHTVKGVAGFEDFVAKIDDLHSKWTYFDYKNHKVEITKDVLANECSTILTDFFEKLRERNKLERS